MVKIKICGITNWADARNAFKAGADFLGFNFYPPSPRYITPAAARRIVRRLPEGVRSVGVFVNESEAEMLSIAREVGLDFLQLHGDEPPQVVSDLRKTIPVIKAVQVRDAFRTTELSRFTKASAFLLDGFDRKLRGATGKRVDWKLAKRVGRERRIFLAGGLTPENAAQAVNVARPYAVDVCSGVESRPGKKNAARMKALVLAVRSAQKRTKP